MRFDPGHGPAHGTRQQGVAQRSAIQVAVGAAYGVTGNAQARHGEAGNLDGDAARWPATDGEVLADRGLLHHQQRVHLR